MGIAPKFPIRRPRLVRRVPAILDFCAGKKVLHLGCADWPYTEQRGEDLLHARLAEVAAPGGLWGVDTSAPGLEALRRMGFERLLEGNVEDLDPALAREDFEVILAGEIIEHLANPGLFLDGVARIMGPQSIFMLTTVNATTLKGFLHGLMRREKVHPDHLAYYSYRTLRHLLERQGFSCREVAFYQDVEGSGLARLLDGALSLGARLAPAWADGVIALAVRGEGRAAEGGS